jgi:hypothetical protein
MSKHIQSELVSLFGRPMVSRAQATDVIELDLTAARMDAVHDATDALLQHSGKPKLQRAVIASLDDMTTLMLCMWLLDTDFASRIYSHVA